MRRIAVITGTRAEWGILKSVCAAIQARADLSLTVFAGGAHLLSPANTIDEVRAFASDAILFEMQREGEAGRLADAAALGRGIQHLSALLHVMAPDIVLVLGDRIEAFAGATAASVGGIHVAHIHGGDRAEGVADEAMRHAITKLAHIHLPATAQSAERIRRMGEHAAQVHVVGSPAIDAIGTIPAISDARYEELGRPEFIFLMHPIGRSPSDERADAEIILAALAHRKGTLCLAPNGDAGAEGIAQAITNAQQKTLRAFHTTPHLPREEFIGLLKRKELRALIGNSSAGLIECAALGTRVLNIGTRQQGRERADNVSDCTASDTKVALHELLTKTLATGHPYGDGHASERIATVLATADFKVHAIAKRNAY